MCYPAGPVSARTHGRAAEIRNPFCSNNPGSTETQQTRSKALAASRRNSQMQSRGSSRFFKRLRSGTRKSRVVRSSPKQRKIRLWTGRRGNQFSALLARLVDCAASAACGIADAKRILCSNKWRKKEPTSTRSWSGLQRFERLAN